MERRTGIGDRGISALIAGKQKAQSQVYKSPIDKKDKLPVSLLQPGKYQPRQTFDEETLNDLSESIKHQGLVQPIIVKPIEGGRYEIIVGERRWRAAKLANLEAVPVVIRNIDDKATIAMAIVENIQRDDLNPIEVAIAIKRFIEEFDFTQKEVAEALGKSRTGVTNLLRLLRLPQFVQNSLHDGDISMGHARTLLILPEDKQIEITNSIIKNGWSVRETERYMQSLINPEQIEVKEENNHKVSTSTSNNEPISEEWKHQQDKLSKQLGSKIVIHHKSSGKGKIEIQYSSKDGLESIFRQLSRL